MARQRNDKPKHSKAVVRDEPTGNFTPAGGEFFKVRVRGHLDSKWADWFDGMEPALLANGETALRGLIVDQAALMGVLNKVHRLNLTLLSVSKRGPKGPKNADR